MAKRFQVDEELMEAACHYPELDPFNEVLKAKYARAQQKVINKIKSELRNENLQAFEKFEEALNAVLIIEGFMQSIRAEAEAGAAQLGGSPFSYIAGTIAAAMTFAFEKFKK